jgi:uncharacterized membrane protein
MINKTEITAATLAAAFASALMLLASSASAGPVPPQPSKDKCYGIALKGHNDCAAERAPPAPAPSPIAGNMSPKALASPLAHPKATAL